MKHLPALLILTLTLSVTPVAAEEVADLADGNPWTASSPEGPRVTMTLNPDGSGRVRFGIISRSITWEDRNGQLCLIGLPRGDGDRCGALMAVEGGFEMTAADGETMRLTRE